MPKVPTSKQKLRRRPESAFFFFFRLTSRAANQHWLKRPSQRRQYGAEPLSGVSLVWLWCGGHTEARSVPRVFTERSEVPLVTLELVCNEAVTSRGRRGPGIHATANKKRCLKVNKSLRRIEKGAFFFFFRLRRRKKGPKNMLLPELEKKVLQFCFTYGESKARNKRKTACGETCCAPCIACCAACNQPRGGCCAKRIF